MCLAVWAGRKQWVCGAAQIHERAKGVAACVVVCLWSACCAMEHAWPLVALSMHIRNAWCWRSGGVSEPAGEGLTVGISAGPPSLAEALYPIRDRPQDPF